MTCRVEVVNGVSYDFCPDELPAPADRIQGILHARFIEELTGNPLNGQLSVSTKLINVGTRTTVDAVAGLVCNPARRFPGLAGNNVPIDMTVSCRSFISQTFHVDLGPFNTGVGDPADFPDYFSAINLGDIAMHREAIVISGRCVHHNGVTRSPLSNATVNTTGLWHQFPAANVDPLAVVEAPNIISLVQGLYAARSTGADHVSHRILQPQAGEEKILLRPAMRGETEVRLSDRVNLGPGEILAFEIGHNELVEYLEIQSVQGATTDTQPATVTLVYPLQRNHRFGAEVVRVIPQVPGAANNLARDGIPGDQTLFLDALTNIDDTTVEISGGAAAEYHRVHVYSVVSDADGYFRLPPISRVAMMQLHASHPGPLADVDQVFSPDYEQFGNRIDLIFT